MHSSRDLAFRSADRYANMDYFAQFLGVLSNLRFAKVSDRFVKEINAVAELAAPAPVKELKTELLIRCLRHLRLSIYPQDALEETATFLQIFANKFFDSHNAQVKHAYAEVFNELLDPIASVASTEVNIQGWMEAIEKLFLKAKRMVERRGHIQVALPLITTVLCVSRKDYFLKNWPLLVDICIQRLRDRSLRNMALLSITRLLWVYLFRSTDPSPSSTSKRIEALLRILFPPRSKMMVPEGAPVNLFVRLVYILLVHAPDSAMEILSPLLQGFDTNPTSGSAQNQAANPRPSSPFSTAAHFPVSAGSTISHSAPASVERHTDDATLFSHSGSNLGNLFSFPSISGSLNLPSSSFTGDAVFSPDRIITAFRAFLLLLADIETAVAQNHGLGAFGGPLSSPAVMIQGKLKIQPPPFPSLDIPADFDVTHLNDMRKKAAPSPASSGMAESQGGAWGNWEAAAVADSHDTPSDYSINDALPDHVLSNIGPNMKASLDKMSLVLGRVLKVLDSTVGHNYWNQRNSYSGSTAHSSQSDSASVTAKDLSAGSPSVGRRPSLGETGTASLADFAKNEKKFQPDETIMYKDRLSMYTLLWNCIDCIPRIVPAGLEATKVVEMVSRYCFHADETVRQAAVDTILRLSKIKTRAGGGYWLLSGPWRPDKSLVEGLIRVVSDTMSNFLFDRVSDNQFNQSHGDEYERSSGFRLLCDLLEKWNIEIKAFLSDPKVADASKKIEMAQAAKFVSELEAKGLLCLCNNSPFIRRLSVKILVLAREYSSNIVE
ncbi:Cell morphogenesis protein PAG1, partial [Cladochytrium tenue]